MDFLGSEYKDLPAEPSAAFIVFEDRLSKRLTRGAVDPDLMRIPLDRRIRYSSDIDQFIRVFEIEIERYFDWSKISLREVVEDHFSEFYSIIQQAVSSEKMRLVKQNVNHVFTSVELNSDAKNEIRELIDKVKSQLDKMNLASVKKDSLYKKLNVFVDEVDRSRTGLAAFAAAQVQVAYEAGLDEQKFERIVGYFERITKALGWGSKEQRQLPKPKETKQITGLQLEDDETEADA